MQVNGKLLVDLSHLLAEVAAAGMNDQIERAVRRAIRLDKMVAAAERPQRLSRSARKQRSAVRSKRSCLPSQTRMPDGMKCAAASSVGRSIARSFSRTVYMPQPMSTPTMLGQTLSVTVIVVPTVQPLPAWTSGMIRTRLPAVSG